MVLHIEYDIYIKLRTWYGGNILEINTTSVVVNSLKLDGENSLLGFPEKLSQVTLDSLDSLHAWVSDIYVSAFNRALSRKVF